MAASEDTHEGRIVMICCKLSLSTRVLSEPLNHLPFLLFVSSDFISSQDISMPCFSPNSTKKLSSFSGDVCRSEEQFLPLTLSEEPKLFPSCPISFVLPQPHLCNALSNGALNVGTHAAIRPRLTSSEDHKRASLARYVRSPSKPTFTALTSFGTVAAAARKPRAIRKQTTTRSRSGR